MVSKIDCDRRNTIHSFPTTLELPQLYSTKSVIPQLAPKYPITTPLPSSSSKRLLDPESPSAIPLVCSKKRLRARRPSSQPAHLSWPAQTVFQATSDSSVALTDISLPPQPGNTLFSPLPVSFEVLNELENLRTHVRQMENEMSALRTIHSTACLLNPDATCGPTNLVKASILIDMIAPEICQRIECRHQVLLINAPDRIPLEHTKTAILTACGMQDTKYTARWLRKSKQSMCCPIIMQFRDEMNAARILEAFAISLRHKTWDEFCLSDDTQGVANIFYGNLLSSLYLVAPTGASCVSGCYPTTRLSAMRHKLRKYRRLFLESYDLSLLIVLNKLMVDIATAKLTLERRKESTAVAHSPQPKMLGRLFHRRCSSNSSAVSNIAAADGKPLSNPADIVESLNSYFAGGFVPSASTLSTHCSPPGYERLIKVPVMDYLLTAKTLINRQYGFMARRSSCHGTAHPFSDRGTLDDRYEAVHVSAMMAWRCYTQCDGAPAAILFRISTATSRPIESVVATTDKFFIRPRLSYPINFRSNLASLVFCHNFGLPLPRVQIRIRCSVRPIC
ncbi:hypothetical protein CLF_100867 [Clonorchis sinensis]|uniref:Uncharacterized protein n=1 Tax=Clonorchis sinensis TaxID=79923 RepID=G7Y4F5_CLOSI|nr:hypothetical protein CLF_100867 [Clonorchis sinensis]